MKMVEYSETVITTKQTYEEIYPEEHLLLPTRRTYETLGWLLLVVLIISIAKFPFLTFMNGQLLENIILKVGWPVSFFEMNLSNPETFPILWIPLILSLIGYVLVSYIIDVTIGLVLHQFRQSRDKKILEEHTQLAKTYTEPEKPLEETKPIVKPVQPLPQEISPAITQAKKVYDYYKSKGFSEGDIVNMFKQKGWKDEDIQKLK